MFYWFCLISGKLHFSDSRAVRERVGAEKVGLVEMIDEEVDS